MATTADGSGAPRRASMPVSSSSGSCPPRPSLAAILVQQPSSQEQEEEGHSRDTVTCTPVLSVFRELSLADVQLRDATTPVLPAPEKLPPPPDSPSIKLSPDPDTLAGNNTESQQGKFYKNRPGSQRVAKKKTSKKNIGIAIGDFNGMLRDELNIKEGEEIEIISKDTIVSRNIGWWTGRNSKGKIGIFPSACVSCDAPVNNSGGAGGGANSTYPLEIMNSAITWKQVVGIGGFGKVFRAIYKGEEVAVKVAKATTFDSLKAVQDVIMEAEKFAHLAHINICSLVGVVLVKDVCLVMEYAHGGALSEVLHKNKTSLPIDVITNWTAQIAAGMNYLHHEADPSLIHRDLKTSNILLANVVDPSDLKNNTIKITDFGLAREIEHTTHMSGAGTYPWMAPEVIRTSDFSKKSDVWSFGVVVWELVTGERPYGGLNLFVVAYGVGHGTLSLPIPEGCPQPLTELMEACWHRDYAKRPSFISILKAVKLMECSDFCVTTTHEEFRSMQTLWRSKIQMRFVELKKMEHDLQKREENLLLKIVEQDKKRKELEEEKKKVNEKAEEYNRLIAQFRQQQELLKQRKAQQEEEQRQEQQEEEKEKEGTYADAAPPPPPPSMVRPPRVKVFSFPKLIQRLWGKDAASANSKAKVDSPLPNRMSDMRAFRRITSSPGNSREKRKSFSSHQGKGHKRRSSDEMGYRPANSALKTEVHYLQRLSVDDTSSSSSPFLASPIPRRESLPSSPSSVARNNHHQPVISGSRGDHQKSPFNSNSLKKELDKKSTRQRSWSDLRSPSPQQYLLPSYNFPSTKLLGTTSPSGPTKTSPSTSSSSSIAATKPTYLGLGGVGATAAAAAGNKLSSQEVSSPSSPNVTVTPADHPLSQYDSGKDSMSSGHSNCSESHPTNMIDFDSPMYTSVTTTTAKATKRGSTDSSYVPEFDPLRQTVSLSLSRDSLFDSKCTTASFSHHQHPQHHHQAFSVSPTPTPTFLQQQQQHQQQQQQQQHQQQQLQHRSSLEGSSSVESAYHSGAIWMSISSTSSTNIPFNSQSSTSPKDHMSPKQSLTSQQPEASMYPPHNIVRPRPKPSKEFQFQTISAPSSRPPSPRERASSGGAGMMKKTSSPTGSTHSMRALFFDSDCGDYYSDTNSTTSSMLSLTDPDGHHDDQEDPPTMIEDLNSYYDNMRRVLY